MDGEEHNVAGFGLTQYVCVLSNQTNNVTPVTLMVAVNGGKKINIIFVYYSAIGTINDV